MKNSTHSVHRLWPAQQLAADALARAPMVKVRKGYLGYRGKWFSTQVVKKLLKIGLAAECGEGVVSPETKLSPLSPLSTDKQLQLLDI